MWNRLKLENKYIYIGSIRLHMELMYGTLWKFQYTALSCYWYFVNIIFLCQDTLRSSNKVILEELDFMNLGKYLANLYRQVTEHNFIKTA